MKKLSLIIALSMFSGIYLHAYSTECVQAAKVRFAKKSMEISVQQMMGRILPSYIEMKQKEAEEAQAKEIAACEASKS